MSSDKVISPEARREAILRLQAERPNVTERELADIFGVDIRTIRRDKAANRGDKKLLKKEIPYDAQARNKLLDKVIDTYETINRSIAKTEAMVERLEEILNDEHLLCDACQRKIDPANADRWGNYFKGRSELARSIELYAKMLGQINDSPIVIAQQMDDDLSLILRYLHRLPHFGRRVIERLEPDLVALGLDSVALAKVQAMLEEFGPQLARELYIEMNADNERRRKRMPELVQIIDGNYRSLPEPRE